MGNLIREGGAPMWFILVFGAVALATAAAYAAKPSEVRERFIVRMSLTTLAATLMAVAADVGATFHHVSESDAFSHEMRVRLAMTGIGESMAPMIVGFGVLTLVALLATAGRARLDAQSG